MSETLVPIAILLFVLVILRRILFIVFHFGFKWSVSKALKTSGILTTLPRIKN